jgi:16S rRNA processing protein RimM
VTASAPCDLAVSAKTHKHVTLGRISGVFGVKGWVKVHSYTEPRDNIVGFGVWTLRAGGEDRQVDVEEGRGQGAGVVAKLRGVDDRDQARQLVGADIVVPRDQLPACAPDEYYWTDLEGLEVRTTDGQVLGTVDHLVATGSNDVLVLTGGRQRLIPFVMGQVIREVDLEAGKIIVDWSPDY